MYGGWSRHLRVFVISNIDYNGGNLVGMEYIGLLGQDTWFHGILDIFLPLKNLISEFKEFFSEYWSNMHVEYSFSWHYKQHLITIGVYKMHTFLPRPIKTRDVNFLMLAAHLSFLCVPGFNGVFQQTKNLTFCVNTYFGVTWMMVPWHSQTNHVWQLASYFHNILYFSNAVQNLTFWVNTYFGVTWYHDVHRPIMFGH